MKHHDMLNGGVRSPTGDGVVSCALIGFDRLFRDMLAGMLQLRRGLRIVAQADGFETVIAAQWPSVPDILVLDGGALPPSLSSLVSVPASGPHLRGIVIAPTTWNASLPDWIGAHDFVVVGGNESFETLLKRLESLFLDVLVRDDIGHGAEARHRPLTDREAEVVVLMGEGLTTKEIARLLGRSVHTIQTHRKRIAEKLGRLGSALNWRLVGHRSTYFRSRQSHESRGAS